MTATVRALKKKAAKKPTTRTASYTAPDSSEFPGWSITVRADWSAKRLAAFQSGNIDRIVEALDGIVVDHNLPDESGEVAASLGDVEPYEGVLFVVDGVLDAIAALPPR